VPTRFSLTSRQTPGVAVPLRRRKERRRKAMRYAPTTTPRHAFMRIKYAVSATPKMPPRQKIIKCRPPDFMIFLEIFFLHFICFSLPRFVERFNAQQTPTIRLRSAARCADICHAKKTLFRRLYRCSAPSRPTFFCATAPFCGDLGCLILHTASAALAHIFDIPRLFPLFSLPAAMSCLPPSELYCQIALRFRCHCRYCRHARLFHDA